MKKKEKMLLATLSSLVAALIIEYLLLEIVWSRDIAILYEEPNTYLLITLIVIGGIAYHGYTASTEKAGETLRKTTPIALTLAFAGIIVGWQTGDDILGGSLIVLAYLAEAVVAVRLREDYSAYSREWAEVFFLGVTIYVASLPAILVDTVAAIVAVVGNHVKMMGLVSLLYHEIVGEN